jgi:hypothetical protein
MVISGLLRQNELHSIRPYLNFDYRFRLKAAFGNFCFESFRGNVFLQSETVILLIYVQDYGVDQKLQSMPSSPLPSLTFPE